MKRQMHLGLFILGTGSHVAGWRYPGADQTFSTSRCSSGGRHRRTGLFDFLFLGDGLAANLRNHPSYTLPPGAADPAFGTGDDDDACRSRRDHVDDLQRSLHGGAHVRVARSHQRRPGGLERGHDLGVRRRRQFRPRASQPRAALRDRGRIHQRGARPVGLLERRGHHRRSQDRQVLRRESGQAAQP